MILFIRSFLFNLCFMSWAMLCAIVYAPMFLLSNTSSLAAGKPWANGTLWLARVFCGLRYEVRGKEYLTNDPVLYASKHQSAWDTMIYWALLDTPVFVLKRELLKIPLWGWYLWRMQQIYIDRSAGASGLKDMIKQAKATIARKQPIIIFPEGTRMQPGAAPDYHPGVIALYSQLKVPVIPVALNSGTYWGKNAFTKHSGTIIIEFLPPILPGLPKDQFMTQLQETIETASARLRTEATEATEATHPHR